MSIATRSLLLTLLALPPAAGAARADVRLPALLADHMVLQRETEAALWGWAEPGETVSVRPSWSEVTATAVAGADGRWRLSVATPAAGGPHAITVTGANETVLSDVLIGEVWICSGQSNMEWPLSAAKDAQAELAAATHPRLRLFDVRNAIALEPRADCEGAWSACTPESAAGFSAVGYFFGRELSAELDLPVGLIGTSWGGTVAEAWTSEGTLNRMPDFAAALAAVAREREDPAGAAARQREALRDWWDELARKDRGSGEEDWSKPSYDDASWSLMELPRLWEAAGLEGFDGVVWFRRALDLPAGWAGRELELELGPIDDMDTTWFNGERVGGHEQAGLWQTPRRYTVPAALVREGRNVVAVRVVDTGGAGGFDGQALCARPAGGAQGQEVSLAGRWSFRVGAKMGDLRPLPANQAGFHQNSPTALYNGMIAPLVPFAIRGAIWYQGESNRTRAHQYRTLFPAMIADWRAHWGRGDFPFYFVQIAPFGYGGDRGEAAELREAQMMALAVPNTGMAVTMDIGETGDIHPRDKQAVAHRLALWALARTYGRAGLECSGPVFRSMRVVDREVRLAFDHAASGLVARGGELTHFTLAGADKRFVPARARIEGDAVVVWNERVLAPLSVRYAWGAADQPNLFNGAGLPAPSFRTDDWPGITRR